jgi:hypothetical protein
MLADLEAGRRPREKASFSQLLDEVLDERCRPHQCKPAEPATVAQVHAIIKGTLGYAVRWKWISEKPGRVCLPAGGDRRARRPARSRRGGPAAGGGRLGHSGGGAVTLRVYAHRTRPADQRAAELLAEQLRGDPERCAAAGIPEGTAFATKPQRGPPSPGTPDHGRPCPHRPLGLAHPAKTPPAPRQNQPLPAKTGKL